MYQKWRSSSNYKNEMKLKLTSAEAGAWAELGKNLIIKGKSMIGTSHWAPCEISPIYNVILNSVYDAISFQTMGGFNINQ